MTSPLELVKRHYLNVSAANFDAEDELFSPDVETIDPGAGTLRGLQAFNGYEAAFQRAFPYGKLVLKSAIEAGTRVAVEGVDTGTHTRPLAGPRGEIPPTHYQRGPALVARGGHHQHSRQMGVQRIPPADWRCESWQLSNCWACRRTFQGAF
jgi:hypothetical protein